jgi:hypothetical protein
MPANRAITVRISEARLRKLMRARKVATQSELINTLLAEEEDRRFGRNPPTSRSSWIPPVFASWRQPGSTKS